MNIMSFNTQHCLNYKEKKIDYQVMADAIKLCNADIVGLQEMRNKGDASGFDAQVSILAEKTGFTHYYFAKAIDCNGNNPYGNGLLSKFPIIEAETIRIPDPLIKWHRNSYETRCILKAKLSNGITVMVTHFGLNPDEQKNAVKTIIKNLENEKCILMGDFNVTPDNKVLAPIREQMKDTADLFKTQLLSFPSDNPDIKIDYIFTSPDLQVIHADIPAIIASDHRPHTSVINGYDT